MKEKLFIILFLAGTIAVPLIALQVANRNESDGGIKEILNQARAAKMANDWGKAVSLYREALAIRDSKPVRMYLIDCLVKLGRHAEAIREMSLLKDLDRQEEKEFLELRAKCYLEMGEKQLAVATYVMLINKFGEDAKTLALVGKLYKELGDNVMAMHYLQQASAKDPEDSEIRDEFMKLVSVAPTLNSAASPLQKRNKENTQRPLFSPGEIPVYGGNSK